MDEETLKKIMRYPKITIIKGFMKTVFMVQRQELLHNLRHCEIERLLDEIKQVKIEGYDTTKPKQYQQWLRAMGIRTRLHDRVDALLRGTDEE